VSSRNHASGLDSDPKDRLAVALDLPDGRSALNIADRLGDTVRWLKVGMELYFAAGNALVTELRQRGYRIFLDLKLHDIPNTVAGGVNSVAHLGAELLTIHASGGATMLRAAAKAAEENPSLRLLAVTVLTSMDAAELNAIGVSDSPAVQVPRLARQAWNSGIRGMVCSAEEVGALRKEFGPEAFLVVPGIRPAGSATDDQKRIATPQDAIAAGASMLVLGRPITKAPDPAGAAKEILTTISRARSIKSIS
jgi:orotidine-5'-phosphate decarboxylase